MVLACRGNSVSAPPPLALLGQQTHTRERRCRLRSKPACPGASDNVRSPLCVAGCTDICVHMLAFAGCVCTYLLQVSAYVVANCNLTKDAVIDFLDVISATLSRMRKDASSRCYAISDDDRSAISNGTHSMVYILD
jgi:hypothetical protein